MTRREDDEAITNYITYAKERRGDDEDITNYITYPKERREEEIETERFAVSTLVVVTTSMLGVKVIVHQTRTYIYIYIE